MNDINERRRLATLTIPAAIHALDTTTDPVARAVLDLHHRQPELGYAPSSSWECSYDVHGDTDDHDFWPCDTVEAVATALHIDLTDAHLCRRPADGTLDLPEDT